VSRVHCVYTLQPVVVKWRHRVYGHDMIAILCVYHDKMRWVKMRRVIVLFKQNRISYFDKCPYDHWLTNKALFMRYQTFLRVFTSKMAAKINWHRYGTKFPLSLSSNNAHNSTMSIIVYGSPLRHCLSRCVYGPLRYRMRQTLHRGCSRLQ